MLVLLLICVAAFFILVWHCRLAGVTLGLPIAYLFAMLFQHLPGALAHLVGGKYLNDSAVTEIGLRFTTIGTVCFVLGVMVAQRLTGRVPGKCDTRWLHLERTRQFAVYCLLGGWMLFFISTVFGRIPSLGTAIDHGAAIWILGALIGFLGAVQHRQPGPILLWLAALAVYPLRVLIRAGFLSFGSTSVFVVMSALLVLLKSRARAYLGLVLFSLVCFLAFLSYFQHRDEIREAAWGGASLKQRIARCATIITDFGWFHSNNINQLKALDERLNQNRFAGMAAQRIEAGQVGFLHGRSIWEGLEALVPRAVWPGKPILVGGSGLVREMAGFQVNENTSYGAGQVMEFYVNYGVPSLIVGFLLFGLAFGWIDSKTAAALQRGEFGQAIMWFLPGVAIIAPLASIAELMGNIAAALVAAYAWRHAWSRADINRPARRPGRKHFPATRGVPRRKFPPSQGKRTGILSRY